MNLDEGVQAAQDALVAMVSKDKDAAARALERIIQEGPLAVHGSLCGWAQIAVNVMTEEFKLADGEGWWTAVLNVETGEVTSLADADLTREQRDAVRIITLWGNEDNDMIAAILKAYLREPTPDPLVDLMIAMLDMAASAARYTVEEKRRAR